MTAVKLIDRLTKPGAILVLLALQGSVLGAIFFTLSQLADVSGGYGILDFDMGYDMARVMEVFGSYGAQGMRLYGRIQALDLINPALYSLVAAVFTRMLWRGHGPDRICLAPLLGGLGDYAENVTLFLMARSFPEISAGLVSVSSTLSLIKNGLLVAGLAPLVVGVAFLIFRILRRRTGTSSGK